MESDLSNLRKVLSARVIPQSDSENEGNACPSIKRRHL